MENTHAFMEALMSIDLHKTDTSSEVARRMVGTIGLGATGLLVLGNALHPFDGSTELYGDITQFAAKAEGTLWVVDHLVLGAVFLVVPWLTHAWVRTMPGPVARVWGRLAVTTSVVGVAIGTIHLGGVDGAALGSFADVLADPAAGDVAATAGEVLLRVHLATFLSWVISFWAVSQLALAVTNHHGGGRTWLTALLALGGILATVSAVVTATEGQLTTLSEPILFRPATLTYTVWLVVAGLDLRRGGGGGGPARRTRGGGRG